MKRIITFISGTLLLFSVFGQLNAQTFSTQRDTTLYTWPGGTTAQNVVNGVNNRSTVATDSLVIKWSVIYCDFPTDWMSSAAVTGVCDNYTCYSGSMLWPSGSLKTSNKYPDGLGDFHLQLNLSSVSSAGTHTMIIKMYNQAVPSDTAIETYIISKTTNAVPMIKSTDDIRLYPNPATNDINIVYDPASEIKNIAVYNIIGKVITVYKVTDNSSANLNLENIPSGIYFVRLMNSYGAIVATKKFTKQ